MRAAAAELSATIPPASTFSRCAALPNAPPAWLGDGGVFPGLRRARDASSVVQCALLISKALVGIPVLECGMSRWYFLMKPKAINTERI